VWHLAKSAGIDLGGTVSIEALNAAMQKSCMPTSDRFILKTELAKSGRLTA